MGVVGGCFWMNCCPRRIGNKPGPVEAVAPASVGGVAVGRGALREGAGGAVHPAIPWHWDPLAESLRPRHPAAVGRLGQDFVCPGFPQRRPAQAFGMGGAWVRGSPRGRLRGGLALWVGDGFTHRRWPGLDGPRSYRARSSRN